MSHLSSRTVTDKEIAKELNQWLIMILRILSGGDEQKVLY